MAGIIGFSAQLVFGALMFWTSIRIVDRDNSKNTFPAALGWCLIMAGALFFPLIGAMAALVVLNIVCFRFHQLELVQTIGVIVVLVLLNIGIDFLIESLDLGAGAALAD